jgi:sialate O-acetylesterase
VKNPVAVRYAYDANPEGANLYNREGLPASPFRANPW